MDYSNGKIYIIKSLNTDKVYIGSTITSLDERFQSHLRKYIEYCKKKSSKYCSSYEIFKYGKYYIELLENYPCETKQQLEKREGIIQKENEAKVNIKIAGRSRNEYYKDNNEIEKQKVKEYRELNKEHIKEYNKNYEIKNKEYRQEYHKQYRLNNVEKIKERNSKRKLVKVLCECGTEILYCTKARHCRSLKHLKLLKEKEI